MLTTFSTRAAASVRPSSPCTSPSSVLTPLPRPTGQNLALYEGTAVLAALFRAFDFQFAPGYLENVKMSDTDPTPMYKGALTLSMVRPSFYRSR